MHTFDDKTPNAIKSKENMLLPLFVPCDDATFKSSYIISSDVVVTGKLISLFDLIVLGDLIADEVDIKGRFVCTGKCEVAHTMSVQYDIMANDIKAERLVCHDKIVAQQLTVDDVLAEGDILIGKTLSVEKSAETEQNIICGETIFGAGKISVYSLITGEDIDLDNGIESVVSSQKITPTPELKQISETKINVNNTVNYADINDYHGYIGQLLAKTDNDAFKNKLMSWQEVLSRIEKYSSNNFRDCVEIKYLIILTEIIQSEYFDDWDILLGWHTSMSKYFRSLILGKPLPKISTHRLIEECVKGDIIIHNTFGEGVIVKKELDLAYIKFKNRDKNMAFDIKKMANYFKYIDVNSNTENNTGNIVFEIESYEEWIHFLSIIETEKDCFYDDVYNYLHEKLLSDIGLKEKFILARLQEKGWT